MSLLKGSDTVSEKETRTQQSSRDETQRITLTKKQLGRKDREKFDSYELIDI